jgi:SAM-dependent methyltransferase
MASSSSTAPEPVTPVDIWLAALHARHVATYRPQEFTRALRALSARYVERRSTLADRSPLDSAGKRSAFAAFYAPLHFLTVREIVMALHADAAPIDRLIDLGCGTGVASAAWALSLPQPARILGSDTSGWAIEEARWNWRHLGVRGRGERRDCVADAVALAARPHPDLRTTGIVAGWSVNELAAADRARLLQALLALRHASACVLIIEPLARGITPWWPEWSSACVANGGRADEWKFDVRLPQSLARLDESAGFERDALGARSLWLPPRTFNM